VYDPIGERFRVITSAYYHDDTKKKEVYVLATGLMMSSRDGGRQAKMVLPLMLSSWVSKTINTTLSLVPPCLDWLVCLM